MKAARTKPTPPSHVRVATEADLDGLLSLKRMVHQVHVDAEPRIYKAWDPDVMRATARQRLTAHDTRYFVAVSPEGQVVGYLYAALETVHDNAFVHRSSFVEFDEISVLPAFRKRGVARALSARGAAWAQEIGASEVRLSVRAFNETAHATYRALGYRPIQHRLHLPLPA